MHPFSFDATAPSALPFGGVNGNTTAEARMVPFARDVVPDSAGRRARSPTPTVGKPSTEGAS